MTSLDLFRTLSLARITRISFREISRNLIWKARAAAVGRFVVVGQKLFSCCLDIPEGSNHYSWQLDGAEIHFKLLHLRNNSAVNYMDTGRCATRPAQYFLGFRCAVGQHIIWAR